VAYVMIVDDDDDFASAVATVLRKAGHEVDIELETASARDRIHERRPDLIVLDVMFPENPSDGFELARYIRHECEDQHIRATPVLMLTAVNTKFPLGFSSKDIDEEWMPVTDFLEKPVPLDAVRSKVEAMLAAASSSAG